MLDNQIILSTNRRFVMFGRRSGFHKGFNNFNTSENGNQFGRCTRKNGERYFCRGRFRMSVKSDQDRKEFLENERDILKKELDNLENLISELD
jgi:hypothetical protein